MALTNVLIAVKTYPTLSTEYDELVCTAGFLEDGSWVRIYPIPFRKLENSSQYKKWQWITIDIERNKKDFRNESYRPVDIDKDILLGAEVPPVHNWRLRKPYALNEVYTNMDDLIEEAKRPPFKSLAVVKPQEVIDFIYEPVEHEWNKEKLQAIYANQVQLNLFEEDTKVAFQVVKKLPYKFSYIFTTEDGKQRTMMIEDWELGMLYWHCLEASGGDEKVACEKVREKYLNIMTQGKDFYFFMGTTKKFHIMAPNPFIIIGTFYPKKEDAELPLDF